MPRRKRSQKRHLDQVVVAKKARIAKDVFGYSEERIKHIREKHSFAHDTQDHKKKQAMKHKRAQEIQEAEFQFLEEAR